MIINEWMNGDWLSLEGLYINIIVTDLTTPYINRYRSAVMNWEYRWSSLVASTFRNTRSDDDRFLTRKVLEENGLWV